MNALANVSRRTKIVCTIGPASNTPETFEALVQAGLNVARLNFSHGSHEDHRRVYNMIREVEAKTKQPIAILQDLQGPKIRLGQVDGQVQLEQGRRVTLSGTSDFLGNAERLPTSYERIAEDVAVGEEILLADGRLLLKVLEVEPPEVHCEVVVPGPVSSKKGINLPNTDVSIPSLTEKDKEDLQFGLELGVDYVAISFVRTAHDIGMLRTKMARHGRIVPIIAKIEKPQAVENLRAIIEAADGVMVARGDLGVELPLERVPTIQRQAIRQAREYGKLTVVATQMLMSMTENPTPTQAEISDVANAVFDGADAVMLSDETAVGAYAEKAVETMAALATSAEDEPEASRNGGIAPVLRSSHAFAISRAAVVTAEEMGAAAIVSVTQKGYGPRLVSRWRPQTRILGCATTDAGVRSMAFYWGVTPLKITAPSSVEELVAQVERIALEQGLVPEGANIVITSKMPFKEGQLTNMLKLHTIERA